MSISVAINHLTRYRYDRRVTLSPHVVRLRPAPHCRTPIQAYSLNIQPDDHFINWQQDPFGNYLARLVFPEKTRELSIEVDLIADMTVINPFDFFVEDYAEDYPFKYPAKLAEELAPYLKIREQGPLLKDWLAGVDTSKQRINDFLVMLNQRLQQDIAYNIRMEPGVQGCDETLKKASGSCRDSAWLLAQILRHLGLASRFVSGYLIQLVADVKALDGPSGTEQDFTDLHAWTEVYIPGAGWIGLDPTSGLFAAEGHIPLACSPDPGSASPVTGASDKADVEFYYHNHVTRIAETPRVTKPYSDEQWQIVTALGYQIDTDLERLDVRLTMGGEPTFVSIDDPDSEQWNDAALGKEKRQLAGDLLKRLRQQFSPASVLHYGQGKWYPGEALPRWALGSFWRKDGEPVWQHDELLADETKDYQFNNNDAERLLQHLANSVGIAAEYVIPAYEDALYYLWQEGQTPDNIDLQNTDLKDHSERRRLANVLSAGLDEPVGFVLPLKHQQGTGWKSNRWPLRREQLYLIPGDSSIGMRLPLDSLPWEDEDNKSQKQEQSRDPFAVHPPLSDYATIVKNSMVVQEQRPDSVNKSTEIIHTALCTEAREGNLYIFLPPVTLLEDYLTLIALVEQAVAALGTPVYIEGYEPPSDRRLNRFMITPDPGVIEVNIHPARTWQELLHNTDTLYEQARQARLSAEKFMLDGRHTGTGGGNHITLGGPTAADSPFLRRPDLLRSLITYWQHHPGLSYLFSGLFIGPTSQAPRIDEARHEALFELEVAFARLPEGEVSQPWLVDRLLRHLLVDLTGNTHRAEFCIDKLYSPDSASGRQGLLELRAFEMPPHARMSLVQVLLVRALIAKFWQQSYKHDLVRWGTELHDRYMLPHYVQSDLRDVVKDLNNAGYAFAEDWLAPFFEFRFPKYGEVRVNEINLELRMALEPWHVLGEEVGAGGTARYVDSSLERLQIKVTGMTDSRHYIACNRQRIPLQNTGIHGEYVAGVRYRAWQPPSALHPTIAVHVPLVFDIIDSWTGRAIGGCTYHVSHPGGRSYDDFPVNANSAEARRVSRFFAFGHTPDEIKLPSTTQRLVRFIPRDGDYEHYKRPISLPAEQVNPEYPYTLDLRLS